MTAFLELPFLGLFLLCFSDSILEFLKEIYWFCVCGVWVCPSVHKRSENNLGIGSLHLPCGSWDPTWVFRLGDKHLSDWAVLQWCLRSIQVWLVLSALGAVLGQDFADIFAEVLEITQRAQDCSVTGVMISFVSCFPPTPQSAENCSCGLLSSCRAFALLPVKQEGGLWFPLFPILPIPWEAKGSSWHQTAHPMPSALG